MDLTQIYSRPLNQGGAGIYAGSKFQNGGLVVYSGSRVQNGGLIFDRLFPAVKETINKIKPFAKRALKRVAKHVIDQGTPKIVKAASKPISKVIGSDVTPLLKLASNAVRKRGYQLIGEENKRKVKRKKRKVKSIFS